MKTIYVHPNEAKPGVCGAVREICDVLRRYNVRILISAAYFDRELENVEYVFAAEAIPQADFIVSLGGDGTMLRLAHVAAAYNVPIIGVNLGHVGFMTELERGEIEEIARVFDGQYEIDSRMMLHLTVERDGKTVFAFDALNDVAIVRGNPLFHVVDVEIEADGSQVAQFSGDGLVIASPTGSTAYSLSAGGPIVEPSSEILVLTPVCAHGFHPGSFVFGANRRLAVRAMCDHDVELFVSADGDENFPLRQGDTVKITRSELNTRLVRVKGQNFYHILQQKLNGGKGT